MTLLVVVGRRHDPATVEEFRFGRVQLLGMLPTAATVVECEARDWDTLIGVAHGLIGQKSEPYHQRALLLLHPHLAMTPQSLDDLHRTLDAGADIAWAQDAAHLPHGVTADYCTLRGMERLAERAGAAGDGYDDASPLPSEANSAWKTTPAVPVALFRASALGAWLHGDAALRTRFSTASLVHDYSDYQLGQREDVVQWLTLPERADPWRVLDVGGGEGAFLHRLKSRATAAGVRCETHLVEMSPRACEAARGRVDHVWPGDFLHVPLQGGWDCITFLDVLEHAQHPLPWLRRAREMLAPRGRIVASIPNVGHWSVVADLLEGRWDYAAVGIHCITHLRFYTRHGIEQMLKEAGFEVHRIHAIRIEPPTWFDCTPLRQALKLDEASLSSYAYLVEAEPC